MARRGGPQTGLPPAEHAPPPLPAPRRVVELFTSRACVAVQKSGSLIGHPPVGESPRPFLPAVPRMNVFWFRFPSRFHLDIPVTVTVAPVSCCRGLYLAVTETA
jgi:hypothetical protein